MSKHTNLALVNAKKDSTVGNAKYSEKKQMLADTPMSFTQAAATFSDWGPTQIDARQKHLAEFAVETWPVVI
jgi:hypothetical protein